MSSDLSNNPAFREIVKQGIPTCEDLNPGLLHEVYSEQIAQKEKEMFSAEDFFPTAANVRDLVIE